MASFVESAWSGNVGSPGASARVLFDCERLVVTGAVLKVCSESKVNGREGRKRSSFLCGFPRLACKLAAWLATSPFPLRFFFLDALHPEAAVAEYSH